MNLRELKTIVDTEFENSMGRPGQELSQQRALAFERYMSKEMGNEVEGESQVVTSDVSDVIDGMMPALLKIFTTRDNLINFDPVGEGDAPIAEQESDYVNHCFWKNDDSFMNLFYWLWDALVLKNGVAMAWWDESESVEQETYKGLNAESYTPLMEDPNLEPESRSEIYLDEATGEELVDITFRRVNKRGFMNWECVPPEEYRISGCKTLNPASARMVGRESIVTRSYLIEMGFNKKQVGELPRADDGVQPGLDRARKDYSDDLQDQEGRGSVDKSQEPILFREAYIKVDYDGDGRAELRQIFQAGGLVLRWQNGGYANAIVDRQPFHVITPHPIPHKHFGRSEAEKHIDQQDNSSTLWRQVFNNLYRTNNPGHNVWEQGLTEDTLDDLLNVSVGSVNRFARPVGESYSPQVVPFTAGATLPVLEWQEKLKRDKSGVSSDADALSPDALKNIQQSVMAQSNDIALMKREAVARIFAETGIKSLFRHIHELLLKHQDKALEVRLNDKWARVDPREWRRRENVTVNIGLGIGTRTQNLMHLNAIWDKQSQLANPESGQMNLTVTPQNMYNTAKAIVRNASFEDPNLFFTDPQNQPAAPPASEEEKLQQQEQELEQRRQQLDQQDYQLDQQKVEIRAKEMALEHQREIFEMQTSQQEREMKFSQQNEELRRKMMETVAELERKDMLTPLEAEQMRANIAESAARTGKTRADTLKVIEEARAVDIENDATETGLVELAEATNAESESED